MQVKFVGFVVVNSSCHHKYAREGDGQRNYWDKETHVVADSWRLNVCRCGVFSPLLKTLKMWARICPVIAGGGGKH
uniref:Uncharacterized protein n=1 Tax=Cucumis melo TaxID=3656 RepID=A0A9I9CF97_CUCME